MRRRYRSDRDSFGECYFFRFEPGLERGGGMMLGDFAAVTFAAAGIFVLGGVFISRMPSCKRRMTAFF